MTFNIQTYNIPAPRPWQKKKIKPLRPDSHIKPPDPSTASQEARESTSYLVCQVILDAKPQRCSRRPDHGGLHRTNDALCSIDELRERESAAEGSSSQRDLRDLPAGLNV